MSDINNLYSSMDRLETDATAYNLRDDYSFIFQYG